MMQVGTQVICINAENQLHGGLVKDRLYTIIHLSFNDDILTGLYFEGFEYPHKVERFRELDDEMFAENLLNKIKQTVIDELGNF